MDSFPLFLLVGFLAQLIDGMLGMAYGVSANTILLAFGLPPAVASASVHAAEVVTTGVSGAAHFHFGNVEKKLVRGLIVPGVIGAVLGAYVLVSVPGSFIKPFVAGYLLLMGLVILAKAVRKAPEGESHTPLAALGFAGGFLDAIGGGGWGPIVASTLLARGKPPRFAVGSVNFAEFFVTVAASVTFVTTIGVSYWRVIAALALGGAIAAPIAAFAVKRARPRFLLVAVGVLIIILSARTLIMAIRS